MPIRVLRMGGSGAQLRLDDGTYTDSVVFPTAANSTLTIATTGALTAIGTAYDWLTGETAANYDVRATPTSGTLTFGTAGVWEPVTSNRQWGVTRSGVGSKTCTLTVEIGLTGSGTAIETATITLTAEVDP